MRTIIIFCIIATALARDLRFKDNAPQKMKCESGQYPPDPTRKLPGFFTVDLDEDPKTRWRQVITPMLPQIHDLIDAFIYWVAEFTHQEWLISFVDKEFPLLLPKVPEPYRTEIESISNMTKVPVGRIIFFNFAYDVLSISGMGCTSIVAQDANGNIIHARNLDYGEFFGLNLTEKTWALTEKLRAATVLVKWTRGGKTLFYSTQFSGYVGLITAVKPQAFSFSMNSRSPDGEPPLIGNLQQLHQMFDAALVGDVYFNGVATRMPFEWDDTFDQAKKRLSTIPLLRNVYFTMAGTKSGEGCVITRGKTDAVNTWCINTAPDRSWFVLQTNHDHWKKAPIYDDRSDTGNYCMNQMGAHGVSPSSIFDVLSSRPVLNMATAYAAIVSVQNGTIESYYQDCKFPCPLW